MLPNMLLLSITITIVCEGAVIGSSTGSEFVFAFLGQHEDRKQVVVINTLQESPAVNVSLTIPTLSISDTFTVTKASPHIARWPNDTCYQPIIVNADGQIFVYAWTTSGSGVTDSFTALPTSSLGTKYHLLQYRPLCSTAELVVVSLGDGDTNITLSNFGVGFRRETTHTLGPYESYVKRASGIVDWTGAMVTSDKPVAVLSAISCGIVPNDGDTSAANGCGLLVEMLPDVDSYGHHFVLTTFYPRQSGFLYRVLASQNGTKFSVTSSDQTILSKSLDAGDFYEGNEDKQFEMLTIRSSKPVVVVQYSKSKNPPYGISDGISEPFMTLIPPVTHYSDDLVFTSIDADGPTKVSITSYCVHHNSLLVDGVPIEDRQQLMAFTSEDMCVSHFDMGDGLQNHSVRHPDGRPFLALAYGTGPLTAFGYPVKYNVHVREAPPIETGTLTEAGMNALIILSSIVGFILLIMMYCCAEWISYRRRRRRAKPWYDIYHTTVRRRPLYAIPSSIPDTGRDVDGEVSPPSYKLTSSSRDGLLASHSDSGDLSQPSHDGKLSSRVHDETLSSHDEEILLHRPCYGGELSPRNQDGELSPQNQDGELSPRKQDGELLLRIRDGELLSSTCGVELLLRIHDGDLSSSSRDRELSLRIHDGELSSSSRDRELSPRFHNGELSSSSRDGELSPLIHGGELSSASRDRELSSTSHDGELSSQSEEFHSMTDLRIHNVNENASVSHKGAALNREDVNHGEFEIVGMSKDGRTIRGILDIVSTNITHSSEPRAHIRLPPLSIESACKINLTDSQSDIVSVSSQSTDACDSSSSSSLSSCAESKDSLMSVEDIKNESSGLRLEIELKDDSRSSLSIADIDDGILKDVVEIASFDGSCGSSVASEISLEADKTPSVLQKSVTSDSSLNSDAESTMKSSPTSSTGVSTSALQDESVQDMISAKQLATDDLSSVSSTVAMSEVESASTLTEKSDVSFAIGEDQVYKLQYYNIWKML